MRTDSVWYFCRKQTQQFLTKICVVSTARCISVYLVSPRGETYSEVAPPPPRSYWSVIYWVGVSLWSPTWPGTGNAWPLTQRSSHLCLSALGSRCMHMLSQARRARETACIRAPASNRMVTTGGFHILCSIFGASAHTDPPSRPRWSWCHAVDTVAE